MQGSVRTTVIHKNDLIVITAAFKGVDDRFLKRGHIVALIKAGNNKRKLHEISPDFRKIVFIIKWKMQSVKETFCEVRIQPGYGNFS